MRYMNVYHEHNPVTPLQYVSLRAVSQLSLGLYAPHIHDVIELSSVDLSPKPFYIYSYAD